MAIKVTFVGSGDAFGSGGRLQTCILVESHNIRFAIDFGTTSLVGLKRLGIPHNSVDAILLTHLHGDHCGGVPFLLMDAMLSAKRQAPLTIAGPHGTESHIRTLRDVLFPGSDTMEPRFGLTYNQLSAGNTTNVLDLQVSAIEARHTRQTNPLALSVEVAGKRIVYTGDGEHTQPLAQLVDGADLLIAECYFFDKPVKWHLNYPDIKRFNAKHVVLTHMHDNMLAQVENVPELCAEDGFSVEI